VIKNSENDSWEIPKTVVRKVESSVRAIIRMLGEQCGMNVRVIEEAGRSGGITTINGKTVPQRHIYYLAKMLSAQGEILGFEEYRWLEYAQAIRKLSTKRERAILKAAKKELVEWLKKRKAKKKKDAQS